MSTIFNLLVGLGIFIYGMNQLELAAKGISGNSLKSWLLSSTNKPLSSVTSGIFLTALLQSSSLVGLIVLAFASAGVIPLINAIGVFLGANLGTTLTGWIVTLLGFKLDIAKYALPFIAAGGIAQIIFKDYSKVKSFAALLLGLGLLLFGLSLMKDSVSELPNTFSIESIKGYNPLFYLLAGVVLTALIQSSSAMMLIALTSLNAGLIDLPDAAALVIGADLGTTSTIVLGSITGNIVKRQLAFAHCFFNLVVDFLAFFLILPFIDELLLFFKITDPLFGLVAFHSFFNLVGLCLFLPFLNPFSKWIENIFARNNNVNEVFLNKLPVTIPSTGISTSLASIKLLWLEAMRLNLSYFDLAIPSFVDQTAAPFNLLPSKKQTPSDAYQHIKFREGDISQYILRIQKQSLTEDEAASISSALESVRSIVYGSKTLKDIYHNIDSLKHSNHKSCQDQYQLHKQYIDEFSSSVFRIILDSPTKAYSNELLNDLAHHNDQHQQKIENLIYSKIEPSEQDSTLLSSQLNVAHEIHHALKNFIFGLSEWVTIN